MAESLRGSKVTEDLGGYGIGILLVFLVIAKFYKLIINNYCKSSLVQSLLVKYSYVYGNINDGLRLICYIKNFRLD